MRLRGGGMNTNIFLLTKEKITFICATFIIILGQISIFFDSSAVLIIALTVSVLVAIKIDQNEFVPFMLLLIAPNRSLTFGPISAPTIIMLIGVLRSLNGVTLKISKNFFIYILVFFGYCVATTGIGESQVLSAFKIVVVLLFIWIYWSRDEIEKLYVKYVKCCSFGCIISTVIALFFNPSFLSESTRFSISDNGGENVLGIICGVMALHLLCIFLTEKGQEKGSAVMAVFLIAIGLITGSRSFLMVLGIGVFSIITISFFKLNIKRLGKILILMVFVAGIGILILSTNDFLSEYMDQLVYRINKLATQDISNGRYEIWKQYLALFKQNNIYFWFGNMDLTENGVIYVAHNMLLEQIASIGIIGSFIISALYISTYLHIIRKSKSYIIWFSEKIVPFIGFIIVSFVSHTLLGVPQTIMLYICGMAVLKSKKRRTTK